jgi:hypothetical protein
MNVIGNGIQSNHLHRKEPPIFEETAGAGQRQSPFSELGHKPTLTDLPFPVAIEFAIQVVDVGFSFDRIH